MFLLKLKAKYAGMEVWRANTIVVDNEYVYLVCIVMSSFILLPVLLLVFVQYIA